MRKALLPMLASLALCGAATAALIATNARAEQSARKPVMLALTGQGSPSSTQTAASPEAGPAPQMIGDRSARRAQFCKDMYARRVGELAFLEAKLSLAPNQVSLFDHWKQASLTIAKQHEDACVGRQRLKPGRQEHSLVDRLAKEETMLKSRLADLDAEKPSLVALYDSLTPAQKQEFGFAAMHGRRGRMPMMMGMMAHPHPPGMEGRMGRGPMGGPGAMDDVPPPPAP